MKAWAALSMLLILALGLASCADTETREQKFTHMEQLAEKGDVRAQYLIGLMYEQGYGVTADVKKAAEWFGKAAAMGEPNAQYGLGFMYYHGQGVPKDARQAAEWYKKAAERGCAPAQAALGNLYLAGEGVPKDIAKAAYWHKRSLQQNKPADFARD